MGRTKLIRGTWTVVGVAAAALVAAFIWNISAYQTQSVLEAERHAQQHARSADIPIEEACRSAEPAALVDCVAEQVAITRQEQRAEYDLSAQNRMAEWAFWMMVVSAVTAGLTAIALWFVKGTLDASREAVKEAASATKAAQEAVDVTRTSAERQLRPYLMVESGGAEFDVARGWMEVQPRIQNTGQTPAYKVRYRGTAALLTLQDAESYNFEVPETSSASVMTIGSGGVQFAGIPLSETATPQEVQAALMVGKSDTGRRLFVFGQVYYEDVFGHEWETKFCRFVVWNTTAGPGEENHWLYGFKRHNEAT